MPNNKERTCGTCTACCKTHAVFSINKPAGRWCEHCDIGKGCRIYDERPTNCRDFRCQWLFGYGERPDKTKVVLDFHDEGAVGRMIQLWEVSEGALNNRYARETRETCLSSNLCVLYLYLDGRKEMFVPPGFAVSQELLARFDEEGVKLFQTQGISVPI